MIERDYTIDLSNPELAARQTLEMHIDTLEGFRHTTPKPVELEWEIRLYRFMLESDTTNRYEQYMEARGFYPNMIPKREVVRKLGWIVP